jgi:Lrp/AsnC family leucine-responsive transcriptional regulator
MFDKIDTTILTILQQDARTSNAEIARQVGLAPSAIFERLRKLESAGLLEGFHARLNPKAIGLGMLAFVFVRSQERVGSNETALRLSAVPNVLEVHNVAGEDCYLVKVRVENPEALGKMLRDELGKIPGITTTRSTIVLETYKETTFLPVHPDLKNRR